MKTEEPSSNSGLNSEGESPPLMDAELHARAIRLIEALHALVADGQHAAATRIRNAAPVEVVAAASVILEHTPRYLFSHMAELRERFVTSDDPEERARQEARLDKSMRKLWEDYSRDP